MPKNIFGNDLSDSLKRDGRTTGKKLACFQKTRNGIVKKLDTTTTSCAMVNSFPLSPEDLI
jgi:hypothetical protein